MLSSPGLLYQHMNPHWRGAPMIWLWLMQQHCDVRLVLNKYIILSSVVRAYCGLPVTERKYYLHCLSVAHQVKPETPTSGGGEQGASKEGVNPVLAHCSFLAGQHLGVVATLEPVCVSSITVIEERTIPYSVCQIIAFCCTQHLCEQDLDTCVQGLLPTGLVEWFCLFNTCTVLFFYSYFILSCFVFITNSFAQC